VVGHVVIGYNRCCKIKYTINEYSLERCFSDFKICDRENFPVSNTHTTSPMYGRHPHQFFPLSNIYMKLE